VLLVLVVSDAWIAATVFAQTVPYHDSTASVVEQPASAWWQGGSWDVVLHGATFVQYVTEEGPRGGRQFGSTNWMMGIAERQTTRSALRLRGMISAEPWTIRGCGYPNGLASGELCSDEPITDRQHPHELVMEAAMSYDRAFAGGLAWQVYAGIAGAPALGPTSYPHRASAALNPVAPIFHHWLDATHVTFGVATGALYSRRWKVEASFFNAREPDEQRRDLDLGRFDSWSGRLSWMPGGGLVAQISAAHLEDAEAQSLHDGGGRFDVDRATASVSYHRRLNASGLWATTAAWGRNVEAIGRTDAFLIESHVAPGGADTWFARYEVGSKPGYDLGVFAPGSCAAAHCPPAASILAIQSHSCCNAGETPVSGLHTVSKLQLGYVREAWTSKFLRLGVGMSIAASRVPRAIESFYGGSTSYGFVGFLIIRPRALHLAATHDH
jgi:hypothetical protein